MNKTRRKSALGILISVMVVLSTLSVAILPISANPDSVVSISSALDVPVDGTANVYVNITTDDTDGVGSARIRLLFDKDVVNIQSVTDGVNPTTSDLSVANANGELNMSWATGAYPGLGADGQPFVFAVIELKAVGADGQSSDLDIVIDKLKDATLDTNDIIATDVDGTFGIAAVIEGDVNNDKVVDTTDAQWVLQMDAGRRPVPDPGTPEFDTADVNDDGFIDTTDAQWILQYDAGRRTSL